MNANDIIELLGGTKGVMELTGLTKGRISQWRIDGIPETWMRVFKAEQPDLFGEAKAKKNPLEKKAAA